VLSVAQEIMPGYADYLVERRGFEPRCSCPSQRLKAAKCDGCLRRGGDDGERIIVVAELVALALFTAD